MSLAQLALVSLAQLALVGPSQELCEYVPFLGAEGAGKRAIGRRPVRSGVSRNRWVLSAQSESAKPKGEAPEPPN